MSAQRRWPFVVVAGLLWLSPSGCGDAAQKDAAPAASSTAPTSAPAAGAYVTAVNGLCSELLGEVLAFDIGNDPTVEEFASKRSKLVPLIKAFDAEVAALPVTASERPAAAAMDAYRRWSDAADAPVAAAAAAGDQAKFDAANEAFLKLLETRPKEVEDLRAVGIQCSAR